MKKVISFCKQYFAEILFVCLSLLSLSGVIYSACFLKGWLSSVSGMVLAVSAQVVLSSFLRKHAGKNSVLQMRNTLWCIYIALLVLLMFVFFFVCLWKSDAVNLKGFCFVLVIMLIISHYNLRSREEEPQSFFLPVAKGLKVKTNNVIKKHKKERKKSKHS